MIILYDTREQKNSHILRYFYKLGIECKRKTLKFGDYSFIENHKSFENDIVIERKYSLNEITINFTKKREQFRNEFLKINASGAKCFLLIENATQQDIIDHKYRSKMHPNALMGSLNSWHKKHDIDIFFCQDKNKSAKFIHNKFLEFIEKDEKI